MKIINFPELLQFVYKEPSDLSEIVRMWLMDRLRVYRLWVVDPDTNRQKTLYIFRDFAYKFMQCRNCNTWGFIYSWSTKGNKCIRCNSKKLRLLTHREVRGRFGYPPMQWGLRERIQVEVSGHVDNR